MKTWRYTVDGKFTQQLTVSAYVEDGSPADQPIGIVVLSFCICSVVLGSHFIRDGTSNGVNQVTIKTIIVYECVHMQKCE